MKRLANISMVAMATTLALLSSTKALQAATIELNNGEWTRFIFPPVGQPDTNTLTFNASPTGARLRVTDAGASGDRLSVSVNGESIGTTSPTSRGFSCGFSPDACFDNPFISSGTFNLRGGVNNIEFTTINSAFPRIGGAGFIRADTSFINLYGTPDDRSSFINILNQNSSGVSFSVEDNSISLATPVPVLAERDASTLNAFGETIYNINSGIGANASEVVNIVVGNSPEVLVGAACITSSSPLTQNCSAPRAALAQVLNMEDILNFPSSGPSITPTTFLDTQGSLVAHEVTEAAYIAAGNNFDDSHSNAILEQNSVLRQNSITGVQGQRAVTSGDRPFPVDGAVFSVEALRNLPYGDTSIVDTSQGPTGDVLVRLANGNAQWWFPWNTTLTPEGDIGLGWEILDYSTADASWDLADVISGLGDSGLPWSGREVDFTLNSTFFQRVEPITTEPVPVPSPSSVLGTITFGILGGGVLLKRKLKKIHL